MAKYRFGDICEVLNGRAYKQNELLSSGKYPILRVGNFFSSDRWYYSDMELPENKYCDYEDLLFAWSASFGPKIWDGGKVIYHYHIWKLIPNDDVADKFYLYYWLQHSVNRLTAGTHGSVMAHMTKGDMENQSIELPSLQTQKKISSILRTIDEKIHNNEAINNNLEQQAQAIFKAWFVDFEPFGGELPNDWKHTKLGTSCNCVLGGTPSRNKIEYWNGTIPWINSGEVNKFRIIKPSETITNLGLEKSATKLLPTKTTVLAITGATLGQVSLLEIDACANQSVVGIIPNDNLPYEYIYPLIKQNIAELVSNQTGGAQQHINKQNVENLDIVIPPYTYLAKYQNTVCSIYEMIANNCFENERLSSLRDNLLPKLMSGELDVSDIEI